MNLVDPEVARLKFQRELELWDANEASYSRRGWVMLRREEHSIDIGFLGRLPLGPQTVPVMSACVRIDFTNFDLWAPSVEFIDPLTGEYAAPVVQALVENESGPQNLLVDGHPTTGRPFFCVPGIRQYHDHPQHSGDSWLLHRAGREGSLATICDRLWRAMARNLLGIHLQLQTMPGGMQLQLRVANAPGEVAPAMWEQAEQNQRAAAAGQLVQPVAQAVSAQMLAALGLAVPEGGQPPGGPQ